MYKVYCDNFLLYDGKREELKLYDPRLDLELNKVSSFQFTIYPNHPRFDSLKKLKPIVKVYRDKKLIFCGRILNDTQGFYNEKQVICEGELAFLIDSIQRPYTWQGNVEGLFTQFIQNHNAQVDAEHQFRVGRVTVVDPNDYINRSDTQYLNTWESINEKLIEPLGGYLIVRHEEDGVYIDYLAELEGVITQEIEFGKNMIDFEKVIKGDELITGVIPLGTSINDEEGNDTGLRLTIESVNGGVDYLVDQEAQNLYGKIYKTEIWEDVTEPENLLRKGKEYLANAIQLSGSITLNAVDLSYVNKEVGAFELGSNVKVKSKPHNLNAYFLVSKMSLDLLRPQNDKLTLGSSFKTFTEQNSKAVSETERRLATKIETVAVEIVKTVSTEYATKEEQSQLEAKIADSDWLDLILNTGWSFQYETDKPQYRKIGNVVYLRGLLDATTSAGTTIGELPEGYRPTGQYNRFACSLNQKEFASIQVGQNGLITDYAKTTSVARTSLCLNGVSFLIN